MTDQKTQSVGTQIDGSSAELDSTPRRPMAYQSPTLKIDELALITRGGTPGTADSGQTTDIPGT